MRVFPSISGLTVNLKNRNTVWYKKLLGSSGNAQQVKVFYKWVQTGNFEGLHVFETAVLTTSAPKIFFAPPPLRPGMLNSCFDFLYENQRCTKTA